MDGILIGKNLAGAVLGEGARPGNRAFQLPAKFAGEGGTDELGLKRELLESSLGALHHLA